MATIVLSTIGTALGGPLGSTIGALIGNRIDHAIGGSGPAREGPRLKELAVTTSSYGTAIARQYGRVRAPGNVLWATDLVESKESEGGGKNRPSTVTYSYSISLAIALSSRPILAVRRIWADGNMLRGAAGDMKVGGVLRVHSGHGDQPVDPLIASDQGSSCPAFRGIAYCVLEALELAEFGNRVPALTFEIEADDGEVSLVDIMRSSGIVADVSRTLPGLSGYSEEGGSVGAHLQALDALYPISLDAGGDELTLEDATHFPDAVPMLPEAVADRAGESFGPASGSKRLRANASGAMPTGLRYYDPARDFQPGLQRSDGKARAGRPEIVELPATLTASDARALINQAAQRAVMSRDTLSWRIAEIAPSIRPGSLVTVPDHSGIWSIESWEWRDNGVELTLHRRSSVEAHSPLGVSGAASNAADNAITPTLLQAFEVPWSGTGSSAIAEIYAAPSSVSRGWNGAALFSVNGEALDPLGTTGPKRCVTGHALSAFPPAQAHVMDRISTLDVKLDSEDFILSTIGADQLAKGANRALIGTEIVQFAEALPLGNATWRLKGLLRGRGGTEDSAMSGQASGAPFALLDNALTRIDPAALGNSKSIAAIGLADQDAVVCEIAGRGRSLSPLVPVHGRASLLPDGTLSLVWTRRARGAWTWDDEVDVPLVEESERYIVGVGQVAGPYRRWVVSESHLNLDPETLARLSSDYPGAEVFVRQQGQFGLSKPLHLTTIQEPQPS